MTVEGTPVPDQPDYPQRPLLSPGFRLCGDEPWDTARELPWGTARDLARVYEEPPTQQETAVRLLGCTPRNALRRALDAGEEDLGSAVLRRLDRFGEPVQDAVEGEVTTWIPSARGPGRVDLTLQPLAERPPSAAHDVWELWADGRPGLPNLWARCDEPGRRFWLTTALANRARTAEDAAPGTTFHLDGRHIIDEAAFFCALGEAVNGPGGYFGWGLDALADCLCGHFGARRPFALVWHDAHIARRCLAFSPTARHRPYAQAPPVCPGTARQPGTARVSCTAPRRPSQPRVPRPTSSRMTQRRRDDATARWRDDETKPRRDVAEPHRRRT
ncbi:barstar family protein [Streptomyces luteolus]|uniref:Barstar family protein n=1 Tax=Streptomyces luteolus TaxID=3043615 RepID=A0ABT6SVJ4_9ACTN|nr:barstar family protein [Streptomyces sp. B-S-A12]MDI3419625.1 barstar family protein [Streptomyces sp. B-S-A12]